MSKRIYVGNLPFSASAEEVNNLFEKYGDVVNVTLVTDEKTGKPKGFGFVEMRTGAEKAIQALNKSPLGDKQLNVNEARTR